MKRSIILLIVVLISMMVNAQVNVAKTKMVEAKFRQTRTSMMLANPTIQTGTFKYEAPDKIDWKYDGLDKVQLPEQMLAFIRQAVSGDLTATNGAFETIWDGQKLTLLPQKKQVKKFFSQISIFFDTSGIASSVSLEEPNGDHTHIEFIKMKYSVL